MSQGKIKYDVGQLDFIYEIYNSSVEYLQPEIEKYICRYCGVSGKNKFKDRAHLIPEFTGAKELFSFNECKDCNNKFCLYENSLRNFGVKNIYAPIKGKGGFKKHKDFEDNTVTQYQDEKTLVTNIDGNENFRNEVENGRLKFKTLSYTYVPLYVYKSLLKLALSFLKTEDLKQFSKALTFINEKENQTEFKIPHTLIYSVKESKPQLKPIAVLMRKKVEYNSPEFTFLLVWGYYSFQIFLPFNDNDCSLNHNNFLLPIPSSFLQIKDGKVRFNHLNMNCVNNCKTELKFSVPFKPSKEYIEKYGEE